MRMFPASTVLLVVLTDCGDGRTLNASETTTTTAEVAAIRQRHCVPQGPPPPGYARPTTESKRASLSRDADVIRAYGQAHPDEFTDVVWEYTMGQRLLAYFTDRLDEHRAALRQLVANPDDVEVVKAGYSAAEAVAIADEIQNQEPFTGKHEGASRTFTGVVGVNFYPTKAGRAAADAVREKFGDGVCVEIAGHPYPKGSWPDDTRCERMPKFEPNADVSMDLDLDRTTTARGEVGTGTLTVTNTGSESLTWPAGAELGAYVVERSSGNVVGGEGRGVAENDSVTAEPGETVKIPVRFTTDDCRSDSDYALPVGSYDVVTGLHEAGSARAVLQVTDAG